MSYKVKFESNEEKENQSNVRRYVDIVEQKVDQKSKLRKLSKKVECESG